MGLEPNPAAGTAEALHVRLYNTAGKSGSFVVNASVAVRVPGAGPAGLQPITIDFEAAAPRLVEKVVITLKSPAFVPARIGLLNVNCALPVLMTVNVVVISVPNVVLPTLIGPGCTGAEP